MLFDFMAAAIRFGGSITVITRWHYYGDHQVTRLRRSPGGLITVITEWLDCGDHGMAL
jgi:hypothetical protein